MTYKHKILGMVALSLLPLSLSAQSETEALRLASPYEPAGSARFAALSGAMGAVGSEASSLVRNPAGISLYRGANRLSLTLGGGFGSDRGSWYGKTTETALGGKFLFEEFYYQAGTNRATRGPLSFAFGIRNAGRFDRELNAEALLPKEGGFTSLADYAAGRTNNARFDNARLREVDRYFSLGYLQSKDAFSNTYVPWISILGAGSGWINQSGKRFHSNYIFNTDPSGKPYPQPSIGLPDQANLLLREKGSITDYDIALGYEANDALHFGGVLTLSSLDYELSSYYRETFRENSSLTLLNRKSVSGFGARLGLGMIYEVAEGLRLGASVYSPTFYTMKMDFQAEGRGVAQGKVGSVGTPNSGATAYNLRGPWRFDLSGAFVVGHHGIISADYEYATLGLLRLTNSSADGYESSDAGFEEDNARLQTNYGGVHTIRLGMEGMLTPRIALRTGYRYSSSPVKNALLKGDQAKTEALVSGPMVHYTLPDAVNSFSLGAGFRLTPTLSLDLAYVYTESKARTFAFPYLNDYGTYFDASDADIRAGKVRPDALDGMKAISESNFRHKAIATLSFRF